jgi:hypothetical protein
MQTREGLVLNLEAICGNSQVESVQVLSSRDRQFIEEYRGFVQNLTTAQPDLLQTIAINPSTLIRRAVDVCNRLRTNTPPQAPAQAAADQEILMRLAPEYYCRELND